MEIEALQMTPVQSHAQTHFTEQSTEPPKSFGEFLIDCLKATNELHHHAEAMNAAMAAGRVEDISQVMVAGQKAEIAIQLALQLRNRAVSAYQEMMRMQV